MPSKDYSKEQLQIIDKIRAEAARQAVPVEFALATADLESGFKNVQNAKGGRSFGPMQVNVVHLRPGQTVEDLKKLDFNIAMGVSILKKYLTLAKGDSYTARVIYFCGPGKCGGNPPARLTQRWQKAAEKWGVPAVYSEFVG